MTHLLKRTPRFPVIAVLALGVGHLDSLQAQAQQPVRVDQYGDALPEGALARLGTLRLVHLGNLSTVGVSPDGKIVASGVSNGKNVSLGQKIIPLRNGGTTSQDTWVTEATIRLWEAKSGKLIREIVTPDAPVSAIGFEPDGLSLFAACGKFMCCWDVSSGKKLWQQEAIVGPRFHGAPLGRMIVRTKDKLISFHDCDMMCTLAKDGADFPHDPHFDHSQRFIRIWDSKHGKPLRAPPPLESTVNPVGRIAALFHEAAVSPDGRFAAVVVSQADPLPENAMSKSNDFWKYTSRRLQIIELETGKVVHLFPADKLVLTALTFADDGGVLALVAGPLGREELRPPWLDSKPPADKEIWLIATATGQKQVLAKELPPIFELAFFDKQLAAKLRDDSIRVWDAATGKRDLAAAKEGRVAATIGDHSIGIRDERTGWRSFALAKGGRVAATVCGDTVRVIDIDSGKPIHAFEGHRQAPHLRFALNSKNTLISREFKKALLWDGQSWKEREEINIPSSSGYWYGLETAALDRGASQEKLYLKESENRLELCDIKTNKPVVRLEESAGAVNWAYFSAAGNRLVKHTDDWFYIFDTGTGKCLSKIPEPPKKNPFEFHCHESLSPRGAFFAKSDQRTQIDIFDVNSGKVLRSLAPNFPDPNRGKILSFQFSEDEKLVLAEVHELIDNPRREKVSLVLWEIDSGRIIQELVIRPEASIFWRETLNQKIIRTFVVSNDHRLVALICEGHRFARLADKESMTIEIWETASGTKRGELAGHQGSVIDLAFSADGRQLASSSDDTTILIWDMRRPLQLSKFENRLSDEMLAAHWETLLKRDAVKADAAIWGLVFASKDSVPFLRKKLRPAPVPDAKRVQTLLAALDSDRFNTRAKAEADLEELGERILAELQVALKQENSLDKQHRLERIVQNVLKTALPFANPGQVRALEVLERAGADGAKEFLRELAQGAPGAQITIAARSALARLETSSSLQK
jgi:WD40 repeat protein